MKQMLDRLTKQFLLKESSRPVGVSYIQSLFDLVEQIRPSSKKDSHRLSLAREHLRDLKRHFRKMEEQIRNLEEQVDLFVESKGDK